MTSALRIPFVIGTGSGGCRIASKLAIPGVKRICINSSWRDLEALPGDVVRVRAGDGSGSGMDPKRGEKDYVKMGGREGLLEAIEKVLDEKGMSKDDVDLVPVVISAGFGFGSGSGPKIVEDVSKLLPKSAVIAWITLPFFHEGEETRRNALKCFKSVASKAAAIAVDNQHVAEVAGVSLTLKDIFARINRRIVYSLLTLLRAAASPNTLTTIDRSDLRRVLGKGAALMFSKSFQVGAKDYTKLYDSDSSLSPYTPGEKPCKVRALAVIQSPRAPSPAELSRIASQCERSLNVRLKAFKSVITLGGEKLRISILLGGLGY
ncbi:hypothetical protein DRO55_01265 [Candidatus Bathyarchaeota archaeon]|nr:MAG: hypothetical protein DRO55_01265 [Candidatus Bathyarchaeota archaeon]